MRTAEFDRPQVLRAAMQLFLDAGYSKTSMQAIKAATGLHPGSIYCAFGNKEGLMLAALEQYTQDRAVEFRAFFTGKSAWQGLVDYLNHIAGECLSGDLQKGCLTHKAMNELAEQLPAITTLLNQQFSVWHEALAKVMASAQLEGDIPLGETPEQLAHFFIMGVYGLRSYAHCQPDQQVIFSLVKQILHGLNNQ